MRASAISFSRLTCVRVGLAALCLALSACASTGRKLADLPEPVASLHIAVDEQPSMAWRGIDARNHQFMNAGLALYMKEIEKTISPTFAVSSVPVSVGAQHELGESRQERYVLDLEPISVRTIARSGTLPPMRSIALQATLTHLPSKLAVWSYVLEVDANPANFPGTSLQAIADEMIAQNIIPAAQRSGGLK